MSQLPTSRTLRASLAMTMVAMCAFVMVAQSGRRVRKPATEAAPVPTPEATPSPSPATKAPPGFTFIVGLQKFGDISAVSLNTYSGVLRSCANRLADSSSIKVDTASQDMSRADAIRQAKAEKEAYVVWLEIRSDSFSSRPSVYEDTSSLYIQYAVFAPTTAKQATSGSSYPDSYRNTRVRIPTSTTQGDYYLNLAARGAAERILDHFHLRLPGNVPRPLSND
ncbi:MAG: hypothetical protein ACRD9S_21180 [Pyrinomonadaceae bacterium]